MESLKTRYDALVKCLDSLNESLELSKSTDYIQFHKQFRDSTIQRFEFTIDTFWKYLREYLESKHAAVFTLVSPREVLRTALTIGVLQEHEFRLFEQMLSDRNLSSHTYNERLAEEINIRIIKHYDLLKAVIQRLKVQDRQAL